MWPIGRPSMTQTRRFAYPLGPEDVGLRACVTIFPTKRLHLPGDTMASRLIRMCLHSINVPARSNIKVSPKPGATGDPARQGETLTCERYVTS